MKLVHVVPHINQEASGPTYSVSRLCEGLAKRGETVEISCLAASSEIPGVTIDLHPQWPILSRFAVSSSLACALREKAGRVDIIHNHSLWSMVNVSAGFVVPGKRAKLVVSPRGTLAPWALRRRREVKTVLWPFQRRVLAQADLLHATSESELADIRALGFRSPIALVPNGIDIPRLLRPNFDRANRTAIFVGRIHPVKGLSNLLEAWTLIEQENRNWRLVIVGEGEQAHVNEFENCIRKFDCKNVRFVGPLFGDDKSRAYFGADLFVLPSHTENFGVVVAEALAHGLPVIVSRAAPWRDVESRCCGWWVSNDVKSLADTLGSAIALPKQQLLDMGDRGRTWMIREFGWDKIVGRMAAAYDLILSGRGHRDSILAD